MSITFYNDVVASVFGNLNDKQFVCGKVTEIRL